MEDMDAHEEILKRHKEEKKELQNQITKLKHSVSKGDKKGKKAVQEKITQMEKDLKEKQDAELKMAEASEGATQTEPVKQVSDMVEDLNLETSEGAGDTTHNQEPRRVSKAQKRRNKKEDAARQRQEEIAQQEVQNETGARNMEFLRLREMLKQRGLQISEIPSDGNCLYNAVAHQINQGKNQTDYKQLRQQAAKYMRDNADDFLPFLTTESGEPFTQSDFDKYCRDLQDTTVWGGHLEIKALSHVLNQPIIVMQSDGPILTIGEGCHGDPVTIVYHRHAFGLGEHYNSVAPLQESTDS